MILVSNFKMLIAFTSYLGHGLWRWYRHQCRWPKDLYLASTMLLPRCCLRVLSMSRE